MTGKTIFTILCALWDWEMVDYRHDMSNQITYTKQPSSDSRNEQNHWRKEQEVANEEDRVG